MKNLDDIFKEPETLKEKFYYDFYLPIKWKLEKIIIDPILGIKNYFRNLIRYSPILWSDQDFDFAFCLSLLDKKLEFMEKYFKDSKIAVGNQDRSDRIRLARKLLSMVDDAPLKDDKIYVNMKNRFRFTKWDYKDCTSLTYQTHVREQKIWYIFNKLIYYNLQSWWD